MTFESTTIRHRMGLRQSRLVADGANDEGITRAHRRRCSDGSGQSFDEPITINLKEADASPHFGGENLWLAVHLSGPEQGLATVAAALVDRGCLNLGAKPASSIRPAEAIHAPSGAKGAISGHHTAFPEADLRPTAGSGWSRPPSDDSPISRSGCRGDCRTSGRPRHLRPGLRQPRPAPRRAPAALMACRPLPSHAMVQPRAARQARYSASASSVSG